MINSRTFDFCLSGPSRVWFLSARMVADNVGKACGDQWAVNKRLVQSVARSWAGGNMVHMLRFQHDETVQPERGPEVEMEAFWDGSESGSPAEMLARN